MGEKPWVQPPLNARAAPSRHFFREKLATFAPAEGLAQNTLQSPIEPNHELRSISAVAGPAVTVCEGTQS